LNFFLSRNIPQISHSSWSSNGQQFVIDCDDLQAEDVTEDLDVEDMLDTLQEVLELSDDEDGGEARAAAEDFEDTPLPGREVWGSKLAAGDDETAGGGKGKKKGSDDESVGRFRLGDETLNLPDVSEHDSLAYRVESLRVNLEERLGFDTFLKAYRRISEADDDDARLDGDLLDLMGPGKVALASLIQQLLVCENRLNNSKP
jgi:hypothetical protein